jgi:hypothetical protein
MQNVHFACPGIVSHHHHMFHPSLYGIISTFHLSLHDITASSYTLIVGSCCHPILLDDINNITSCITSCPIIMGITSCLITMWIIHQNSGSDKLFQFTHETTVIHTSTMSAKTILCTCILQTHLIHLVLRANLL